MNSRFLFTRIVLSAILILLLGAGLGYAQQPGNPEGVSALQGLAGTAFTYQGRLKDGGSPANGVYDLQFTLYADSGGASLVAGPITIENQSVTDGYFTVQLDFGSGAFNGEARYLEVGVRPGASVGLFTNLSPLQQLTPAPLALALPGLRTQQNAYSPNLIGGYSGNEVPDGVIGATIAGGGADGFMNLVTDHLGTISGGALNQAGSADLDLVNAWYATVGGGGANIASAKFATVPGGNQNTAAGDYSFAAGYRAKANHQGAFVWGDSTDADIASTAADQFLVRASGGVTLTYGTGALRLLPSANSPNLIAGYSGNEVTPGVSGATIAGGGFSSGPGSYPNKVTDHEGTVSGGADNQAGNGDTNVDNADGATIGGGWANQASGSYATVGGGYVNQASGSVATVGGGDGNQASNAYATVGGGAVNQASGNAATVGGGGGNQASNAYSTVGGGGDNQASGEYATVPGGRDASATHFGEMAYASGAFGIPFIAGTAQTSQYVLRNFTTDANPTSLFLDGFSSRLTIASGRTLTFDILVVARSDTGLSAGYRIFGVIANAGGTTSMVGAGGLILGEDPAAASWNAVAADDDTNDALDIRVNGAVGVNIRWVAFVRTVEVAW